MAGLRITQGLLRGGRAAHELITGLFGTFLTGDEKDRIARTIYSRAATAGPSRPLAPWEIEWFERRLPDPPARLLVGGAGAGAEVRWLLEHRYAVDALEPVPAAATQCAKLLGQQGVVAVASYEELSSCVLDGVEGPVATILGRPFDAILLGWGSLSHVLAVTERTRLLRACRQLAPRGPILASFLVRDPQSRPGRARRMGEALGRGLARPCGRAPAGDGEAEAFVATAGFVHLFSSAEVQQLALDAGMGLVWEWSSGPGYPHVTFLPE